MQYELLGLLHNYTLLHTGLSVFVLILLKGGMYNYAVEMTLNRILKTDSGHSSED